MPRKKMGSGANDLGSYQAPDQITALQNDEKDDIAIQNKDNVAQKKAEKTKDPYKISFRMKPNEHSFFTKAAKLNNTTISGEMHRALAEYMRKHPI